MQAETKYRLSPAGTMQYFKLGDTLTGYVSVFMISYLENCNNICCDMIHKSIKEICHGFASETLPRETLNSPWFCKRLITFNKVTIPWRRHQMETFSASLAICAGNSLVTGEFPAQRPVTRGFRVFFDLRLNKQLRKQSWGWWFETQSRPLWRHCNG